MIEIRTIGARRRLHCFRSMSAGRLRRARPRSAAARVGRARCAMVAVGRSRRVTDVKSRDGPARPALFSSAARMTLDLDGVRAARSKAGLAQRSSSLEAAATGVMTVTNTSLAARRAPQPVREGPRSARLQPRVVRRGRRAARDSSGRGARHRGSYLPCRCHRPSRPTASCTPTSFMTSPAAV